MLDQELLRAARDAGTRADAAADAAETARDEYHDAIRRLQLAGATMREIAEALDVSHQRVQQIIDARGGGRRWRRRRADSKDLTCSFCASPQSKVKRLVSGPGIYICDRCIVSARQVVSATPSSTAAESALVQAKPRTRCGFCGKTRSQVGFLVEPTTQPPALPSNRKYDTVAICSSCLDLCDEIAAADKQAPRR